MKTWDAFKRLIRWNKFEVDPVCAPEVVVGSKPRARSGTCAIAARGDLPGPHGSAFGGIDAKVLKVTEMQKALSTGNPATGSRINAPLVEAQAGPSHDDQPPFSWDQFPNVSHVGMPERFDFDWVSIQ